ncbi:MAG: pyrophosphate--fructose-6-phosphate 1-phosphotransferase [Verrucomicrobia bacterium 21-51-4]|nr:MAG: pyrophosphate--fructose-6-phosphate 1-phosphotransferase [Verrucomicrobia bacterium 21-51-4]HQU08645.1 pyrophosphate--fructose-6-phosphate 1-phosphotransferase [Opitutales bacterium]
MRPKKVAFITAGGIAPCLASSIGGLIERYQELAPDIEMIGYLYGYQGILQGQSLRVTPEVRAQSSLLHHFGGSPLGNSRVKLTNIKDCVKRGLIQEDEDPRKKAADQLMADGVDVLHTIGGDDTNTSAGELADYMAEQGYQMTVIGLPKTIDNDVYPIRQSLGAWTAAEEGARFFENVVGEHSANPKMLIVHEVMGRNCGWLTAATSLNYWKRWSKRAFLPHFGFKPEQFAIHGVFIPEMELAIESEAKRLKAVMDTVGCVNLFVSEGAGATSIIAEMEARGEAVVRDAFGHVKLDSINPGQWFGKRFAQLIGAEKVLVQKSGYFARAAAPHEEDLRLIKSCVDLAVDCALRRESGVIGHDEDRGGILRAIEFSRIKGGKPFDPATPWFKDLLGALGQSV